MAKKPESDPEQYKRFLAKVKELEDAGELNPIADEAMERTVVAAKQNSNRDQDL
ncbi:hypothetical protein [Dinoroseobacter sp. S124A]|uniref:hypothetical protein n=1 Tax=Dinoroseobacter sp. S124A TaxID=3415128 RepID=UPI003C7E3CA4